MTKEEIEDYINAAVEHALNKVEYSNYFLSEIKGYAEAAQEACNEILYSHKRNPTKRQKSEVDNEVVAVLTLFMNDIDDFITEELLKIEENEREYLKNVIEKTFGVTLVIPAAVIAMLSKVPMGTGGTPESFGEYLSGKLGDIYNSMTNQSFVFGEDYDDLIDEYDSRFNAFNRGLDIEAETMGYSLADEYDRIVFTKNDKKLPGYIWVSMLDTNTCLECASLSGTRYEKIEDVPYHPRHDRCRCFPMVCTDEIAENIPESYSEWFEKQDDKTKYKVLGKSRFQLYKNGMNIKQFVNNGKVTPLTNIKTGLKLSSDKAKEILNKQQPVNPKVLNNVVKGLEKNGYTVTRGPDIDRHLEKVGKEAFVMPLNNNEAIVFFHSKLSASGMYEEIIHLSQIRRYGYEYASTHTHEIEVEAKIKLLKNARIYDITDYEKEVIRNVLNWHLQHIGEE